MSFSYQRAIHFPDTDAAGVVFFPNYLSICHEAYEEALAAAGVELRTFFSERDGVVLPISRSEADYLRPLFAGDRIRVTLAPTRLSEASFSLACELVKLGPPDKVAARVRTEHVCIKAGTRERTPLPPVIAAWVDQA